MWTKAMLVAAATGGIVLAPMHNWTADLNPMPGHRITGRATFDGSEKDVVKVNLTLENAPVNTTVQWHIHQGACSQPDAEIIGEKSAYTPAQTDASGRANSSVSVPVNLNASGYSIRVHAPRDTSQMNYPQADTTTRDTTMIRDTTVTDTTTSNRDINSTQQKTTTWQSQNPGGDELAACGDLRPDDTERANRQ